MAGQINISGAVDAVQLHGNDSYTVARDFTFPDESGELALKNDNPTFESINGGPLAGLRNQIINGGFEFNQRGRGATGSPYTLAANGYSLDRWFLLAGDTYEQIPVNAGVNRRGIRITGGSNGYMRTMVETLNSSFGQFQPGSTWTISILATAAPTFNASFADDNNVVNNPIEVVPQTQMTATSTVFGSLTRFVHTFTIPSGIVPSANTKGLLITFRNVPSPAVYSGCQLEPGPVATPFEQRPYGMELSLCQRYYIQGIFRFTGVCNTAGGDVTYTLPTTMRVSPRLSTPGSLGSYVEGAVTIPITGFNLVGLNSQTSGRIAITSGPSTFGRGLVMDGTELAFDAEL